MSVENEFSKKSPLISVIIPVYNTEKYLIRCLDSVIRNSYKNLQIICVNDGSTDRSLSILRQYEKKDPRIEVIDQPNQKLSAARNTGIDAASGDWIALLDSDDWLHQDYFLILQNIAEKSGCDVIICGANITEKETETDPVFADPEYQTLSVRDLRQFRIPYKHVWARLIRRDVCGDIRFFSGTEPTEDSVFNTILFNRNNIRIAMTDLPLYYYYTRPDSAIHSETGIGYIRSAGTVLDIITSGYPECRRELLLRSLKDFLSGRFTQSIYSGYQSIKDDCSSYIRKVRPLLVLLSPSERIRYTIFLKLPSVYYLLRIANDPTLIGFIKGRHSDRQK